MISRSFFINIFTWKARHIPYNWIAIPLLNSENQCFTSRLILPKKTKCPPETNDFHLSLPPRTKPREFLWKKIKLLTSLPAKQVKTLKDRSRGMQMQEPLQRHQMYLFRSLLQKL